MATRIISTLILLTSLTIASHADMSARDATNLVKEYVAEDTTAGRREAIKAALAKEPAIKAQKGLKSALKKDATRPAALELAVALKTPGLFDTVEKYIDGDDEDLIVKLGFITGDKGAGEFLADRWAEVATDSAAYAYLQEGFTTYPVDLDAIQAFEKQLEGERASDAGKIVAFQFGADTTEPATLVAQWDDLEAAYELDAKVFDIKGTNMLDLQGCAVSGDAERVGSNYRLKGEGKISIDLPDEWNTGDFTVVLHVRAVEGELQRAGLHVGRGVWLPVHREGEWSVTAGSAARFAADYTRGEWTEIRFVVEDTSSGSAKFIRKCDVMIGKEKIISAGETNGEVRKFEVHAHGGSMVVGGMQIFR